MVRYSKEDVLNEDERMKLIAVCKNDKEKIIIKTLLNTGMRVSEFCNMKEQWIDWHKGEIHIPARDGDWTPKTKAGSRIIPLSFEIKNLLYKYFQNHKEIEFERTSVWRIVKRVGLRLRPFKKVYPHSLRATYASMLAERGLGASDIQYIMGWTKLETANSYVRSTKAVENTRKILE